MDLVLDPLLKTFREEVRTFIRENLPSDIEHRVRRSPAVHIEEDVLRWRRILHQQRGWSVPHWPVEYGGTGWSPMQLFILEDEAHRAHAPQFPWQNTHMIGPVLYTFGTPQQKQRFLPPIVRGDYHWAQGFSEPGSGSDLASLRTTARLEGDEYVINGQKVWTSGAAHSKWIFLLVKTDTQVKPQLGISMILVPLDAPGIRVRPLMQLDHQEHLSEVFFDNVRVPAEQLVGAKPGAGWSYAKFLLDNERTESSFIYWSKRELAKVRFVAQSESVDGRRIIDDPVFCNRLAQVEAELMGLEWSVLRVLAGEKSQYHHTAVASCLKLRGSMLQQQITTLQFDALGRRGLRRFTTAEAHAHAPSALWPEHVPGTTNTFLWARSSTIQGGARQIQLGLVARMAFGF